MDEKKWIVVACAQLGSSITEFCAEREDFLPKVAAHGGVAYVHRF